MRIENLELMEEGYLLDRDKLYRLFGKGAIDESGAPIAQKKRHEVISMKLLRYSNINCYF